MDTQAVETRYAINFWDYFAKELEQLNVMQEDGLLVLDTFGVRVQPAGRLLIRNICMVFDYYMNHQVDDKIRYSKVI